LAKKFRLSGKEISLIHKKGRRFNIEGVSVKYLANSLGYPRFAVNVPTSVSKKATERNRLRRLVYRELGQQKGNIDCLIRIHRLEEEKNLQSKIRKICVKLSPRN